MVLQFSRNKLRRRETEYTPVNGNKLPFVINIRVWYSIIIASIIHMMRPTRIINAQSSVRYSMIDMITSSRNEEPRKKRKIMVNDESVRKRIYTDESSSQST